MWQQNGANLTGNIVIQTPITFTNKMFRLSLTGYNYLAAKNEINLNIGVMHIRAPLYFNMV